jgi:hypothetical protein
MKFLKITLIGIAALLAAYLLCCALSAFQNLKQVKA